MNVWQIIVKFLTSNPALVAVFFAAIQTDQDLTPTEKAAVATFLQAELLYQSKTAGWIQFAPDAGGSALQIFHIQP